ncbi:hypothetical protein CHARACLAT_013641 [Characodon lateralis]|uniref:Uncharacterized protein n=1 Tax=Characodon lateralis TaxID=208331 RepID=A0ABU7CZL8_9TELE|nr:hypothetical protein [Characodon lateralis]
MHTNPHINPPTCLPQSTSTAFFHKANHFHWTSQPQTDLTSRSKGGMETLMSPLDQAFHEAGAKLHVMAQVRGWPWGSRLHHTLFILLSPQKSVHSGKGSESS